METTDIALETKPDKGFEFVKLNNGVAIPPIGYGTYKIPDDAAGVEAVIRAVATGYRLIDGASAYGNEKTVGEGIRECGVARERLFVTGKVWPTNLGYDKTLRSFEKSLDDLGLDYLDMFLIHWPAVEAKTPDWRGLNAETWRAMERLADEGAVRAIGVSNFMTRHLEALVSEANICPAVDQVELNPGLQQNAVRNFCGDYGIRVEAWSPLARGRVFGSEALERIAEAHGCTVAQVCLRWELQSGIIPIPKSQNPERMRQNLDIFGFRLSEGEMLEIDSLPTFGCSGLDPDHPTVW